VVILVQKSRRPRRWAGVALFAGVLVAALWAQRHEAAGNAPVSSDVAAQATGFEPLAAVHESAAPTFSSEPLMPNAPATAAVPEGMTSEQWLALQEKLKDHPQRDAEIARISEYMAFQSRLSRYRDLRTQTGAAPQAAARGLAGGLLESLPTHVARGELSAGEAALAQAALIDTLLPDAAAREQRRAQERQRLADALPVPADLRASADANARFLREQAALVAAWQALPAAQRDPQQLEASIAALRQSIFDRPHHGGQQP
jgi:hypothetical protein